MKTERERERETCRSEAASSAGERLASKFFLANSNTCETRL